MLRKNDICPPPLPKTVPPTVHNKFLREVFYSVNDKMRNNVIQREEKEPEDRQSKVNDLIEAVSTALVELSFVKSNESDTKFYLRINKKSVPVPKTSTKRNFFRKHWSRLTGKMKKQKIPVANNEVFQLELNGYALVKTEKIELLFNASNNLIKFLSHQIQCPTVHHMESEKLPKSALKVVEVSRNGTNCNHETVIASTSYCKVSRPEVIEKCSRMTSAATTAHSDLVEFRDGKSNVQPSLQSKIANEENVIKPKIDATSLQLIRASLRSVSGISKCVGSCTVDSVDDHLKLRDTLNPVFSPSMYDKTIKSSNHQTIKLETKDEASSFCIRSVKIPEASSRANSIAVVNVSSCQSNFDHLSMNSLMLSVDTGAQSYGFFDFPLEMDDVTKPMPSLNLISIKGKDGDISEVFGNDCSVCDLRLEMEELILDEVKEESVRSPTFDFTTCSFSKKEESVCNFDTKQSEYSDYCCSEKQTESEQKYDENGFKHARCKTFFNI